MKLKFILQVIIGVSLLTGMLAFSWIRSKEADLEKEKQRLYAGAEKISVLVATRPLPNGTVIQASDIGMLSVFATSVTDDNILRPDATNILGRTLIHPLNTSNPILWTYLNKTQPKQHPTIKDDRI